MSKPRKKYDPHKNLKNPIHPVEHYANVKYCLDFKGRLENNAQTFRDFECLTLLHRFTFYGKHITSYSNAENIRTMIEKIYTDTIVPSARYDAVSGTYKHHNMSLHMPIHHLRRKYLIAFIEHHCEELLKITDRRVYSQIIYAVNTEHKIYLKLIENKCPMIKFIDKKAEDENYQEFRQSAKKFKVLTERLKV